MPVQRTAFLMAGRILVGAFYIIMAVGLIKDFAAVTGLMVAKGIPQPALLLALTIVVWAVGGASLLFDFRRSQGALLLLGLTLVVSVAIHNFWAAPPELFANEMQHFMKNLAICGALLCLAAD